MRVVAYHGPKTLVAEDREPVGLGRGEARLLVEACGVCGTDVRIFKGEHRAYDHAHGRVPGHEIVGRLVELGAGVESAELVVGDRYFVAPNLGCGACAMCVSANENLCSATQGFGVTRDGAFAEQLIVPAAAVAGGNLIPIAPGVDSRVATLIEPLACVLRGQRKIDVGLGDRVFVAGGGPVGLLHVALAKAAGASMIVCSDPSAVRRAAALRAGAGFVIDPVADDAVAAGADITDGTGFDVVVTAAPVHALQTAAVEQAARLGRILLFGGLPKSRPHVEIDSNIVHYRELTIVGTTASTNQNCRDAALLVTSGVLALEWMVSDTIALDDFAVAIDKVQDGSALKVVLEPGARGGNS